MMYNEIKLLLLNRPNYINYILEGLGYKLEKFQDWSGIYIFYHSCSGLRLDGGISLEFLFDIRDFKGEIILKPKNKEFNESDKEVIMDTIEFLVKCYKAEIKVDD